MNSKQTMVPFSPEWKTFVADAIGKAPSDRTQEEREAIAMMKAEPADLPFGIRCERDGTGKLAHAAAWFKAGGVEQRYATLAIAQQVAQSLNLNSPACLQYEARAFVLGLDKEAELSDATLLKASKLWAREHIGLAEAVAQAQAFAALETERVDKYIDPIFAQFEFVAADTGKRIRHRDDIYLAADETKVNEFWARCEEAHQANGFKGERGTWPNRQAEHLRMKAEAGLVQSYCDFLGTRRQPWGKKFDQMVKLLISACLAVKSEVK